MIDKQKWKQRLIRTREKGRLRYSIERGIMFGFFVFIFSNLFKLGEEPVAKLYFSQFALFKLGGLILVGIVIYGIINWSLIGILIKEID